MHALAGVPHLQVVGHAWVDANGLREAHAEHLCGADLILHNDDLQPYQECHEVKLLHKARGRVHPTSHMSRQLLPGTSK